MNEGEIRLVEAGRRTSVPVANEIRCWKPWALPGYAPRWMGWRRTRPIRRVLKHGEGWPAAMVNAGAWQDLTARVPGQNNADV